MFAQSDARRLEPFVLETQQEVATVEIDRFGRSAWIGRESFELRYVDPNGCVLVPLQGTLVGQYPRRIARRQSAMYDVVQVRSQLCARFGLGQIGPKRKCDGVTRQRTFLQQQIREKRRRLDRHAKWNDNTRYGQLRPPE